MKKDYLPTCDHRPGRGRGYDAPSTGKTPIDFGEIDQLTDDELEAIEDAQLTYKAKCWLARIPQPERDHVIDGICVSHKWFKRNTKRDREKIMLWICAEAKRLSILEQIRKARK